MDQRIRAASGHGAAAHPADSIDDEADDAFAKEAKWLGVAPDLVDAACGVVPNAGELSGAALRSAIGKAIEERPSLRTAEPRVTAVGRDGGAGREARRREPEEPSGAAMDAVIRSRARRIPPPERRAPNGVPIRDDAA